MYVDAGDMASSTRFFILESMNPSELGLDKEEPQ